MTSCPTDPLSASADIDECPTRPRREWPHCCTITDTPSSRCCGGCTALCLVRVAISIYVAVQEIPDHPYGAGACFAYMLVECSRMRPIAMQFVQGSLCIVVALDAPAAAVAVWLALFGAITHMAVAFVFCEAARLGDCRRCMNQANACGCGAKKDPLPPGSLHTLVALIEVNYRTPKQRQPNGKAGIETISQCLQKGVH
jgi:hypothetical protein